jgi:hypothetical protein
MKNTETSRELARKITILQDQVNPLLANLNLLRLQHRDALSREFIAANRITIDDVKMSDDASDEWGNQIATIADLAKWLRKNSTKKWAEWHGKIYHASDIAGSKLPQIYGLIQHLKK